MQRWIVIGGIVLCLLLGGGVFGVLQYRGNKPDLSYLPIPFNQEATQMQKEDSEKSARQALLTDKVLGDVARDTGAKAYFGCASDAEALAVVKKSAFIEIGSDKDQNNVPYSSLRVGFRGKRKDQAMLQKMAERLGKEIHFGKGKQPEEF